MANRDYRDQVRRQLSFIENSCALYDMGRFDETEIRRADIALAAANKDGGAHVDAEISRAYTPAG